MYIIDNSCNLLSLCSHAKSLQSCITLCNSVDCSSPGSSVHEILQTRILEWVAVPSSRGSSRPRDWTRISCLLHWQAGSLPLAPPGKLWNASIRKFLFLIWGCIDHRKDGESICWLLFGWWMDSSPRTWGRREISCILAFWIRVQGLCWKPLHMNNGSREKHHKAIWLCN